MEKDFNIEVGKRLFSSRKAKSMTRAELGKILKLHESTIKRYEDGEIKSLSIDKLKEFAHALGVDPGYIMGWIDSTPKVDNYNLSEISTVIPSDIINLPIVGTVRAGQPIFAIENIEGHFPAPKTMLSSDKEYFYLKVKGDSMNLKFQEGSLLLVEKCSTIENGEIGVVLIDGLEATVKKVVSNENIITLIPMSSNPEHVPMIYDIVKDEVRIIGKVKFSINFL